MSSGSSWGSWMDGRGWRSRPDRGLPVRGLTARGLVSLICGAGMLAGMTGCGTPGSPQPPSLKLPAPASDLTAERAGERVTLRWTTTRKTTDHLLIQGAVQAHICLAAAGSTGSAAPGCEAAGDIAVQPGKASQFEAQLPPELLSGDARVVRYFVELRNARGKSAGASNTAAILAGAAPAAVTGVAAEVRADGVALRWNAGGVTAGRATAIRLHRTLLTSPARPVKPAESAKRDKSPMKPSAEPLERNLWVEAPSSGDLHGSLDATARFGESYAYVAQRVARVTVDGQTLELGGPLSEAVRVDVIDRFPPAVPRELAAVAAVEEKSIDLSWTPDTDADLAGYIVYRHGEGDDSGGWQRISGTQPVAAAAWRDTTAEPGQTYLYHVTAIDQTGHESAPSEEARETLPKS